jgi:pilus assembly protein Flp/PilA
MRNRFFQRDDGTDLVEYALLVGLVALATVAALADFSGVINDIWTTLSARLSS